ncbi:coiled-coil domain-containing protein 62 [Candoia aspera]|uniref:coiled-coil domain-containing protein 62 n=1 Tax=Candoia aspera TaxID=51853 RepID=UPI002FD7EAE4
MGQKPPSEPESDTIQKQRQELQLLIALLEERDKELNNTAAIHQKQFLAWKDDRQKILTLEERSSRLENELQKRNEMISTLTRRLKVLECQENDHKSTLESTQHVLQKLSQKASDQSLHCQTLEEKNQALTRSVMELSNKVGQLQAREEELQTMLSLKDNDILEAANHIAEFTSKFKKLEIALREAKNMNKEKQDFKLKLKEVMLEASKLKEDLNGKTKENNAQREEIIQLKQENAYLSNELMFTAEMANRKDQLLFSAKAKELRTDTELNNLRQIYLQQQRDLQFLQFNLESSQECKQNHKTELQDGSRGMVLSDLEGGSDRDSVCSEVGQNTHFYLPGCPLKNVGHRCQGQNRQRERRPAIPEYVQRGPFCLRSEELRLSSPRSAGEAENRSAVWLQSPWKPESREAAWASQVGTAAPLPNHEHWLGLNPHVAPSDCSAPRVFDKSSGDCKDASVDLARIAPRQSPSMPSPRNQERMEKFELAEKGGGGSLWCRELSESPRDALELKRFCSLAKHKAIFNSDRGAGLNVFDLDAPCFTSTQKSKETKAPEMLSGAEHPSGLSGCGCPPTHHDSRSPTSELQQLLAKSWQVVNNSLCTVWFAFPTGLVQGESRVVKNSKMAAVTECSKLRLLLLMGVFGDLFIVFRCLLPPSHLDIPGEQLTQGRLPFFCFVLVK